MIRVPDDRVATSLSGIKARCDLVAGGIWGAGDDVKTALAQLAREDCPSLLKAVEAVLELTDSAHVLQEVRFPGIPEQQPFAWDLDPSKIREAITAALLGEAGDGTR